MWRFDPRKMAEDGGRWLTWLLGTERCTTNLQPAAGGIFRGQRGVESGEGGEGDKRDRCVALRSAEDGGRWRKMGGECNIYAGLTFLVRAHAASQKSWESWGGAGLLTRGPLANTIQE